MEKVFPVRLSAKSQKWETQEGSVKDLGAGNGSSATLLHLVEP